MIPRKMFRKVIVPEMMSLYSTEMMIAFAPCPTVNSLGTRTDSVSPVGSPVAGSITSTLVRSLSSPSSRSLSHLVAAEVDEVGIAVRSTATPR